MTLVEKEGHIWTLAYHKNLAVSYIFVKKSQKRCEKVKNFMKKLWKIFLNFFTINVRLKGTISQTSLIDVGSSKKNRLNQSQGNILML